MKGVGVDNEARDLTEYCDGEEQEVYDGVLDCDHVGMCCSVAAAEPTVPRKWRAPQLYPPRRRPRPHRVMLLPRLCATKHPHTLWTLQTAHSYVHGC